MAVQRGVYAHRNRGHRTRQLTLVAQARDEWELLRVAFDGFRAAIRLLTKRRQALGTRPGANREAADALVREVTAYLRDLTGRIDKGEFDASTKEVAA